jgi:dihydrolipoamide dehydrogenase
MGEVGESADLVVIGGGPGGYTAALHAARLGRKVTMIDDAKPGGVCLHIGCIPSKALIDFANAHATRSDLLAPGERVDLAGWQTRRKQVVDKLTNDITTQLRAVGVTVITGRARFTSRSRIAVAVSGEEKPLFLEFENAIIATGSRPAQLPAVPFDGQRVLNSTDLLALREVPANLVVVGAGYIGIEFATAFAKLGSNVTIVERQDRVLPEMPAIFARVVGKRLAELGVQVRTGAAVSEVSDQGVHMQRAADQSEVMPADTVLVAVGRVPNTDDLGLDAARIGVDPAGRICVSRDCVVPGTTIAAIGDVVPGPMLAHKATAEAVVAAEALSGSRAAFDPAAIPLIVFSDPEIASAGYAQDSARAEGLQVESVTIPMAAVGRAVVLGAERGFCQLVIDTERDAVVGVHIAAPHAAELISEGVLAIEMGASPADLALSIHPHPTLAEVYHIAARRYIDQRSKTVIAGHAL